MGIFASADAAKRRTIQSYSDSPMSFLTDPWGTYIELTENLAPAAN